MRRLEGKRAIITGAGSGIGRASALRFAAEGAAVLCVGRTRATLEETAAQVAAAGGRAEAFVARRGLGTAVSALPDARAFVRLPTRALFAEPSPIYGRAPDAKPMTSA